MGPKDVELTGGWPPTRPPASAVHLSKETPTTPPAAGEERRRDSSHCSVVVRPRVIKRDPGVLVSTAERLEEATQRVDASGAIAEREGCGDPRDPSLTRCWFLISSAAAGFMASRYFRCPPLPEGRGDLL